ncbi:MAG: ribbon-helix-helix protein, CopG family [candidate division NC10 bacterium]|nr:ribbon-helix-helix protein, CopG family [candidate division NC10 bacterium]
MKRTTIFLPDTLHEALRTRAFEERTSMGEEIRRAVEQYLTRKGKKQVAKKKARGRPA